MSAGKTPAARRRCRIRLHKRALSRRFSGHFQPTFWSSLMIFSMVWLPNHVTILGGADLNAVIPGPRLCPLGQSRRRSRGTAPENACGVNESERDALKTWADGGVATWAGT